MHSSFLHRWRCQCERLGGPVHGKTQGKQIANSAWDKLGDTKAIPKHCKSIDTHTHTFYLRILTPFITNSSRSQTKSMLTHVEAGWQFASRFEQFKHDKHCSLPNQSQTQPALVKQKLLENGFKMFHVSRFDPKPLHPVIWTHMLSHMLSHIKIEGIY